MALSAAEKLEWLSTDNHRIVLMDLDYHDGTSVETLRFSSYPYVMPIGDTWNGFTNLMYDDLINHIPNITTRIDSDSTIGSISLYNTDGEYDALLEDYTLVGHPVKLYIGESDWIRDNFIIILDGIVEGVSSSSPSDITLTLRDKKESLNVPLQTNLYETDGSTKFWDLLMDDLETNGAFIESIQNNGPYDRSLAVISESVENTHVPICLGKCFNIEPVLIDAFNHVYQIHDGPIVSVDEVRSNGVTLEDTGTTTIYSMSPLTYWGGSGGEFIIGEVIQDVSNDLISGIVTGYTGINITSFKLFYENTGSVAFALGTGTFYGLSSGVHSIATAVTLETTTGGAQYEIDLDYGCIRLLNHPNGTQITCDVVGQDGPSLLRLGGAAALTAYSAADMLEWLLLEKGAIVNTDICYETFPSTGSKGFPNIYELGFFSKSEDTVLSACTRIINSVGGFMRFKSSDCKLQIFLLDEPAGKDVDLDIVADDILLNGLSLGSIEEPKKAITLGYLKNWKPQDEGSLAGAVLELYPELLELYKNEYSTLYTDLGLSSTEYPLAEEVELIETSIFSPTDAATELARRVTLRGIRRRIFKIQTVSTPFTYSIGDIAYITHDRFGFSLGKNAMIIGIEESPTRQRVNLEVWL